MTQEHMTQGRFIFDFIVTACKYIFFSRTKKASKGIALTDFHKFLNNVSAQPHSQAHLLRNTNMCMRGEPGIFFSRDYDAESLELKGNVLGVATMRLTCINFVVKVACYLWSLSCSEISGTLMPK